MASIIEASHVFFDCPATTRDEAFLYIAEKACGLGLATDAPAVVEALNAREAEGSTGMMNGFAIPHCRCAAVKTPSVLVVKFAGHVDWKTMDKSSVRVAVALLIPDDGVGNEHLRLLSKIAVLLMHDDFCDKVKASTNATEIVDAVEEGLAKE